MEDHLAWKMDRERFAARRLASRLWVQRWMRWCGRRRRLLAAISLEILQLHFELVDVAVQPLGRLIVALPPQHRELQLDPLDLEQRRG